MLLGAVYKIAVFIDVYHILFIKACLPLILCKCCNKITYIVVWWTQYSRLIKIYVDIKINFVLSKALLGLLILFFVNQKICLRANRSECRFVRRQIKFVIKLQRGSSWLYQHVHTQQKKGLSIMWINSESFKWK